MEKQQSQEPSEPKLLVDVGAPSSPESHLPHDSLLSDTSSSWSPLSAIQWYNQFADDIYERADPRGRDWPLVGRMDSMLLIGFAYVTFVWLGPKVMARRKAFELKRIMTFYNIFLVILSTWMFLELLINSRVSGYNYLCVPYKQSYAPSELRIVRAIWVYYISKGIEFLDTVFMILKKKNNQVTALHVYHHIFMWPLWYAVMVTAPCCQAVLSALVNSFIHVIMYTYYALSVFPSLHPYLWWKRYLTQMQLAQFVMVMCCTLTAVITGCDYPFWLHMVNLYFLASLVVLFSHFYIQSYTQRRRDARQGVNGSAADTVKKIKAQ